MKQENTYRPEDGQTALMKKQNRLLTCIAALLAVTLVLLAVGFLTVNRFAGEVQAQLSALDVDAFNGAVGSMQEAADLLNQVDVDGLNKTVTSLKGAADHLSSVDMDALNGAVTQLSGAATTLQGVDVNALNKLVQSLESVASRLESAVNAIGSIFGRS